MSVMEQIRNLAVRIEDELGGEQADPQTSTKKKMLFGVFATLWNDAEQACDTEALAELSNLRPRLCVAEQARSLPEQLSMILRFALAIVVSMSGCTCLLAFSPLRLLHPFLRSVCGVPNGNLPFDLLMGFWARGVLAAAGVKVRMQQGMVKHWGSGCCGLVVYNHASSLDPFIVNVVCNQIAPKYIGKQILFKIPIFGWLAAAAGMIPINRGNREKAVRSMNVGAAHIMERWGRCVAVSPEGTRSHDGHLTLPFKKGVFHLQEHAKVPLLPVVIHGAYELWPPSQLFALPGEVMVSFLPRQDPPESVSEGSREEARVRLQRSIAENIAENSNWATGPLSLSAKAELFCILACTVLVYWQFYRLLFGMVALAGLGVGSIAAIFIGACISMSFLVDNVF